MPTYTNRQPDVALLQCWIERSAAQWLDANVTKKRKGTMISMLLAAEQARREESARVEAEKDVQQVVAEQ
jgi:hypothetical protein